MKVHNLLSVRYTGAAAERLHDGQIAVERSNTRWCSDGFEVGCDNKEKVPVTFGFERCDRETIAHIAITEGLKSKDAQTLVVNAVESRFGRIDSCPNPSNASPTTTRVSSPVTPHLRCMTSAWSRVRRRYAARDRTVCPSPSSKPTSAITSR